MPIMNKSAGAITDSGSFLSINGSKIFIKIIANKK